MIATFLVLSAFGSTSDLNLLADGRAGFVPLAILRGERSIEKSMLRGIDGNKDLIRLMRQSPLRADQEFADRLERYVKRDEDFIAWLREQRNLPRPTRRGTPTEIAEATAELQRAVTAAEQVLDQMPPRAPKP